MLISFLFSLGVLFGLPLISGLEAFGFAGMLGGIILSWIIIGIAKLCEDATEEDEEILGTYVTEARHYEPWTERIKHKNEQNGKVTYEIVEHRETWEITVAEGDIFPISEYEYRRYVKLFGNENTQQADHSWEARGEILNSGYCHTSKWQGIFLTACYVYVHRTYINPVLRSDNTYTSEEIDKNIIKTLCLTEYSEREVYGTAKDTDDAKALREKLTDYNCWYREKNIKLNFILLKNAKTSQAMYWQQYWKNGKRNTINAVVGVDSKNKIRWVHVFGWQNEATRIKLRNFIAGQKTLSDITKNFNQVEEILKENYKLPDFKQYDFVPKRFPYVGTFIALFLCLALYCGMFGRVPHYNDRAQNNLKNEQYELAKSNYELHLKNNPNDVYALYNLGVIYWRENNCEEAVKFFSRAEENEEQLQQSKRKNIYRSRGICFKILKQNKKAIADMKKAIKQDKYDALSYCSLYALYKSIGYKKSRWALDEKYQRIAPNATSELKPYESPEDTLQKECKDYSDGMFYLLDKVGVTTGRAFTQILNETLDAI